MTRWATALLPALACAALAAGDAPLPSMNTTTVDGEVMHANTLEVIGLAFRDITAKPRYGQGKLEFVGIEAKAYRGRATGWYAIDLLPDEREERWHRFGFELVGVDLATLTRSLGSTNDQLAGRVDGWFKMALPVGDRPGISGRGQIDISDGTLVQLPLLVSFLAGNPAAARGKDRLTARFQLRDGGIDLLWLRLESPAIRLAAQGRIGFDGRLEIEISPRLPFELLRNVPLLGSWAATGLSRLTGSVTRAYVRGHISQPVIVIDAFGK
jgi:hypothetical protein